MPTIENWSITIHPADDNPFQAPETLRRCVRGLLHDDPRLETGELRGDVPIRTSPIVKLDLAAKTVQTRNTLYQLGAPDSAYVEWVNEYTPRLHAALVALILVILSTVAAQAQVLDAPRPSPKLDKVERQLLTAYAADRALDVASTHYMITRGNHEVIMPRELVDSTPAFAGYSAVMVGTEYLGVRLLNKRHHRKLAKVMLVFDVATNAGLSIDNFTLPNYRKRGER
jgi:hypothetical protein